MNYLEKALKSINDKSMGGEDNAEVFLNTPIRELKRPLAVHSQILDEIIYLVRDEQMARQIEGGGKVAYLPEEIAVLSRKLKTMEWGEWIVFLKILHMAKKTFERSKIQA